MDKTNTIKYDKDGKVLDVTDTDMEDMARWESLAGEAVREAVRESLAGEAVREAETEAETEALKELSPLEHIRLRPGMYIGATDVSGVHYLMEEIMNNAVDAYMLGYGGRIELTVDENRKISVRNYGQGIPFNRLYDATAKPWYSTKYNSKSFKKTIGKTRHAGYGLKVANALSDHFSVQSFRNKKTGTITFSKGKMVQNQPETETGESDGVLVTFIPDGTLFDDYHVIHKDVEEMVKRYVFLNKGLVIIYNGVRYTSQNGLPDLLRDKMKSSGWYPPIHLTGEDIEIIFCHNTRNAEEYYCFVNGSHIPGGGTPVDAFQTAYLETIRHFFDKEYADKEILSSIIAVIAIKVQEPVFEGATGKFWADGQGENTSIKNFVADFIKRELTEYLQCHPDIAVVVRDCLEHQRPMP